MKASIVVRCFNEERGIGKLLFGISQQRCAFEHETIVVDSGSTDGTLEIARRYPARIVSIRSEEFSFGRALNLGCGQARGEFLVVASAHVYPVYNDWLERLLAPFAEPVVGAVYGKQRGAATTRFSEHQVFAHWFKERSVAIQDTPFSNNANCAVRRSLWQEHPYDEGLTGLEDLEWAKRIMERGFAVSYCAEAEVIHVHNETFAQIKNRYRREAIAHKRIFPEQGMSFADMVRLFAQNTASDYMHAARERRLKGTLLDIPLFRLMQFWGAYQGFRFTGPVPEKLRGAFYYARGMPRFERRPPREAGGGRAIEYDGLEHHGPATVD